MKKGAFLVAVLISFIFCTSNCSMSKSFQEVTLKLWKSKNDLSTPDKNPQALGAFRTASRKFNSTVENLAHKTSKDFSQYLEMHEYFQEISKIFEALWRNGKIKEGAPLLFLPIEEKNS